MRRQTRGDYYLKPIRDVEVVPFLPPELEALRELAYNLRWAWEHEIIDLFLRLDHELWETSKHNPVLMLGTILQEKLNRAAADAGPDSVRDRQVHRRWHHQPAGLDSAAFRLRTEIDRATWLSTGLRDGDVVWDHGDFGGDISVDMEKS